MNQHKVLYQTVARTITNYRPRGVDLYHWIAISEFVQQAVTDSEPPNADEARRRMTLVSALTDWVTYTACFPTERQSVFDLDVIAEFIDVGNEWSPKVRKMARARLKTMAKTLNPDHPKDLPEETAYTTAWNPQPYTHAEVAALDGWARGQRTPGRRVKAHVLLALTLGAGLYSHEVVALRVRDIAADDDGVVVTVRGQKPRQVPVLGAHERALTDLAANVPAAEYAFAPGRTNRKSSVIQNFVKSTNMTGLFPNPRRLRATWIVTHLKAGVPPSVLVPAAGLTNLRSFERWVYAFPEYNTDEYRAALRRRERDRRRERPPDE